MKISRKLTEPSHKNVMKWQHDLERDMASYEEVRVRRGKILLTADERWDVPRNGKFVTNIPNPVSTYASLFTIANNLFAGIARIPLRIKNMRQSLVR